MEFLVKSKSLYFKAVLISLVVASISPAHAKPDRIDIPFRETPEGFCQESTRFGVWKEFPRVECFINIRLTGEDKITHDSTLVSPGENFLLFVCRQNC